MREKKLGVLALLRNVQHFVSFSSQLIQILSLKSAKETKKPFQCHVSKQLLYER